MDQQYHVAEVRSRDAGGTDTRNVSYFCFLSQKGQQVGAERGREFEFDVAQMIYWKQWTNEELTVPV